MRALVHLGPTERVWKDVRDRALRRTPSAPKLLRLVSGEEMGLGRFVTHRAVMDDKLRAHGVFAAAARSRTLAVVPPPDRPVRDA